MVLGHDSQRDGHLDSLFFLQKFANKWRTSQNERVQILILLRTFNVAYILTKFHNDGLNLKRLAIIAYIQTNGRTNEVKTAPDFYQSINSQTFHGTLLLISPSLSEFMALLDRAWTLSLCRSKRPRFEPRSVHHLFIRRFHLLQYQFASLFCLLVLRTSMQFSVGPRRRA